MPLTNSDVEHIFGVLDGVIRSMPTALTATMAGATAWRVGQTYHDLLQLPAAEQRAIAGAGMRARTLLHKEHALRAVADAAEVAKDRAEADRDLAQVEAKAEAGWTESLTEMGQLLPGADPTLPCPAQLNATAQGALLRNGDKLLLHCKPIPAGLRDLFQRQVLAKQAAAVACAIELLKLWLGAGLNVKGGDNAQSRSMHPQRSGALKALKQLCTLAPAGTKKTPETRLQELQDFVERHLQLCVKEPPVLDAAGLAQESADARVLPADEILAQALAMLQQRREADAAKAQPSASAAAKKAAPASAAAKKAAPTSAAAKKAKPRGRSAAR